MLGVGLGSIPPEALARASTELLPTLFGMVSDGRLRIDVETRALRDVATVWQEPEPPGVRTVFVP